MTETLLITWMAAIGAALLTPMWARLRWGLCGAALPTGAAAYVSVSLFTLAVGMPFTTISSLAMASLPAIAVTAVMVRRRPGAAPGVLPAAIAVGGVTAGGLLFRLVHLTRLTVDSARYLMTADVLETTGSLHTVAPFDLRMRHLVTPLLHTPGVVEGSGYSPAITPLIGTAGLLFAGWLAWQAFERLATNHSLRWSLLGAVGLLVVTSNRFVYHAFYVNGHMFFAVFLVVGAGLAAMAAAEGEWRWVVPASLAYAAIVPLRPEGVITVAIFLVPVLVSDRVRYSHRWVLIAPYLAATVLWNGIVWPAQASSADLGSTGPVYGNLLVAVGVAAGLGLLAVPAIGRHARWGPPALAVAIGGYVVVSATDDPTLLRRSLESLGANIGVEGLWGTLWWLMPVFLVGAWLFVSPASPVRSWLTPLPIFAIAVLAFAYLRGGPYRIGTGDSGNRMLLHVVLVAAVAVVSAAAEAAAARGAPAADLP